MLPDDRWGVVRESSDQFPRYGGTAAAPLSEMSLVGVGNRMEAQVGIQSDHQSDWHRGTVRNRPHYNHKVPTCQIGCNDALSGVVVAQSGLRSLKRNLSCDPKAVGKAAEEVVWAGRSGLCSGSPSVTTDGGTHAIQP